MEKSKHFLPPISSSHSFYTAATWVEVKALLDPNAGVYSRTALVGYIAYSRF